MPKTLRELHSYIYSEAEKKGLPISQAMYAVGWILYDLFERADQEESDKGCILKPEDFDGFARELHTNKIARDIDEAQQDFGRSAYDFLEEEIQSQIKIAIDSSVVAIVKSYTSGWRTFGSNVAAGVVSAFIFSIIIFAGYEMVKADASSNVIMKQAVEGAHPATASR